MSSGRFQIVPNPPPYQKIFGLAKIRPNYGGENRENGVGNLR